MIKLEIIGETPAKKNQRIINRKTGMSFPSKRYSEWHKSAVSQLFPQQTKYSCFPINEPCRIKMSFIHGDLRRRDSDNGTSSILDLLTDCGILVDDNWQIVRELQIENDYQKSNPKCRVEIEPV